MYLRQRLTFVRFFAHVELFVQKYITRICLRRTDFDERSEHSLASRRRGRMRPSHGREASPPTAHLQGEESPDNEHVQHYEVCDARRTAQG